MAGRRRTVRRPQTRRPSHFSDAGLTLLRGSASDGEEIWCRCDSGPHGFLSIAAHAHADALAIEVRHGGTEVLADPGTYCYHGEPGWRSYFRSTLAHNTIEVNGQNQSTSGGPFLWTRHARSELLELETAADGEVTGWSAEHDGYRSLDPPLLHRRSVRLASEPRRLEIVDRLETTGGHAFRVAFHLGPEIEARMTEHAVELAWASGASTRAATLFLPDGLSWSLSRGASDPVLGWYSPRFGKKQPTWAVIGEGTCGRTGTDSYTTVLQFQPGNRSYSILLDLVRSSVGVGPNDPVCFGRKPAVIDLSRRVQGKRRPQVHLVRHHARREFAVSGFEHRGHRDVRARLHEGSDGQAATLFNRHADGAGDVIHSQEDSSDFTKRHPDTISSSPRCQCDPHTRSGPVDLGRRGRPVR